MSTQPHAQPTAHRRERASADELQAIVARALDGDLQAWARIIELFSPLVRGVIARLPLSRADQDDVCQTVWMTAWEHIAEVRDARALPGWLSTTARRAALRQLRSDRLTDAVDPVGGSVLDRGTGRTDIEDIFVRREERRAVRDGLASLEPKQRELLLLLHSEPAIPYREIGRRLGIPVGSIGPFRARYLRRLGSTSAVRALAASA